MSWCVFYLMMVVVFVIPLLAVDHIRCGAIVVQIVPQTTRRGRLLVSLLRNEDMAWLNVVYILSQPSVALVVDYPV